MKIYIFGAHSRARTLWIYLHKIYPNFVLGGYLVNNDETNPDSIDNVKVIHIDRSGSYDFDLNADVYLGIRGIGHADAVKSLSELGFKNFIPVTPDLDTELRNKFLNNYFSEKNKIFNKLENNNRGCTIYVIRSVFDKPLASDYTSFNNEVEIQVGVSMSDARLKPLVGSQDEFILCDNIGDNISDKNKQFCELTGLYWVWKNRCTNDDSLVGFVHYRRHFLLPDDWHIQWGERKIDVILPTPLYVQPSLLDNYRQRHIDSCLEYMFEWIASEEEKGNTQYNKKKLLDFFKQPIYSPCNMFITTNRIFADLCEWLFPILFAISDHCGAFEDAYQNRYPGFLAERLISYYFMDESKSYNIVYADKNFLF